MAGRSSRRTLISEMPELDSAYHDPDGVHIAHEMENPKTYLRDGKAPERQDFEVLKKKRECVGNFDASGIPGTNTFAHGHVIRNYRGSLLDYAYGKAYDPCKGKSSGYMEIVAYSKMVEKIDPRKCPVLEARCDNQLSINVLNGSKSYETFRHARHYRRVMERIRDVEKTKYQGKKKLRYKWVRREQNFSADHVSHKGRSLDVDTDVDGDDKMLEYDWTLKKFVEWDKPTGRGFSFFKEVKAAASKRHNLNKRVSRCYNCGEVSHLANMCPYEKIPEDERPCLKCGLSGHIASGCKRKREESESESESDDK